MRWGAMCLLLGTLSAAGCATGADDQRVQEKRRWQRVRERCQGKVLLARTACPIMNQAAPPEPPPIPRECGPDLNRAALDALPATVRILIPTDDRMPRTKGEAPAGPAAGSNPYRTPRLRPPPGSGDIRVTGLASGGSGIIINPDGLILTNDHVIRNAARFMVALHDGSVHRAELVARDPRRDLAVIRIRADGLPSLTPRALDAPSPEDPVVALGSGADAARPIRVGRILQPEVSLQGRLDPSQQRYYGQLLETTAPIECGFSGGPLLDRRGRLIGINVAVARDQATGRMRSYAIPLNAWTCRIIGRLAAGGAVEHGYLGAYVRNVAREESGDDVDHQEPGALIEEVLPDSPAARAGLLPGDIVGALGGTPIRDADHLVRLADASPIGLPIDLSFRRNDETRDATIILDVRP